jgi:hypothetical protein
VSALVLTEAARHQRREKHDAACTDAFVPLTTRTFSVTTIQPSMTWTLQGYTVLQTGCAASWIAVSLERYFYTSRPTRRRWIRLAMQRSTMRTPCSRAYPLARPTLSSSLVRSSHRHSNARQMYHASCLCWARCSHHHTFDSRSSTVRAVPCPEEEQCAAAAVHCEQILWQEVDEHDASRRLLCLEQTTLTRTVIPFSREVTQGTLEERADVAALTAALERRFDFRVRDQPPARTARTDAERLVCGPRWLWNHPSKQGPCRTATAQAVRRATELLPGAVDAPISELSLRDADDEADVSVYAFAAEWADAMGDSMCVADWRRAAKRLATPSRKSPTRADLVSTVLSYQLAEGSEEEPFVT